MSRSPKLALATALLLAAAVVPADATTIRLHPLGALAGAAERVTHGTVVDVALERTSDGSIWSVYTLRVDEELKAPGLAPGTTFTVRQPGGTLGEETQLVVGFPHFEQGDELVLFLHSHAGTHRILNAWQGALRVQRDHASPPPGGEASLPAALQLFPSAGTKDLTDFKSAVREALAEVAP